MTGPRRAPQWLSTDDSGRWLRNDTNEDGQVLLWDSEAPTAARPLALRRGGSWYATGTEARGDWLVATPKDRLTLWPAHQPRPTVVTGYLRLQRPPAFSADSRWLATSWSDGTLRLWPVGSRGLREPKTLELPETTLWTSLTFDPQGRYLFAVGGRDRARIVPLDGSRHRRLPVHSEDGFLVAGAVSPSGRRVATAWNFGPSPKTLRLHEVETGETREFPLPEPPPPPRKAGASPDPNSGSITSLAFANESTLYSAGDGGVHRWNLETGAQELVAAAVCALITQPMPDGQTALALFCQSAETCTHQQLLDLMTGQLRPPAELGARGVAAVSGDVGVVDDQGTLRVGRVAGGPVHWLVGHDKPVQNVAISPNQRWVASTSEDDTLRLWPMPDLSKPALHALPREALISKLRSLTNLRAIRSPADPLGWRIEIGPFPG